jgi:hypothetical protein
LIASALLGMSFASVCSWSIWRGGVNPRYPFASWLVMLVMLVTAACQDKPSATSVDSAATRVTSRPNVTGTSGQTGWDSTAGPVMIIATLRGSPNVAVVLPNLTDSTLAATSHFELDALSSTPLELFGSRGLAGSSALQVSSQASNSTGCVGWPIGSLTRVPPVGWRAAFEKSRAIGLPLDSIEAMTNMDSSRFVGSILQAVSSLNNGGDSAFRGIPYFVRKGYRLALPSSSVLIAEAVRRINEEANPREEHLLLLTERLSGSAAHRVAFFKRSAGSEESLETSEILAAVRFTATNRPAIVITFDHEDGGKVGLLERVSETTWRIVWKSAYTDC